MQGEQSGRISLLFAGQAGDAWRAISGSAKDGAHLKLSQDHVLHNALMRGPKPDVGDAETTCPSTSI